MLRKGDKVKIREDLERGQYGADVVIGSMFEYRGKEARIKEVIADGEKCRLDVDDGTWNWTEEMFENRSSYKGSGKLVRAIKESVEKWRDVDSLLDDSRYYDADELARENCGFCRQYPLCSECPVEPECNRIQKLIEEDTSQALDKAVDVAFGAINRMIEKTTLDKVSRDTKFKVGDLIRGTEASDTKYNVTNSSMRLARVTEGYSNLMEVKILVHKQDYEEGMKYDVKNSREFFEEVDLD